MSYANSLSKNISSPSLQGNYSINPSQGTPNNNIQNINNVLQNPKEINEIKEDEKESDNEENDFDEIAEEEIEDDKEEKEEKNEEDALQGNKPETKTKLQRLFIYLRSGFVWRPIPKIKSTVLCLEITGVIFIVIGIVITVLSHQIKEIEIRYDNKSECQIGSKCYLNFTIEDDMSGDVFVYYRMKNFYQNHRRYIKSKSNKQLKGNWYSDEDDIKNDCDPIKLNKDLYEGIRAIDANQTLLDPNEVAHPCGLIAKSYFNDTFEIKPLDWEDPIIISDEDIAWSIDKKKYKNLDEENLKHQWIDVEKERFIVWMRPAALPDFRKPWGRIKKDLKKGNYALTVENNYPVKSFDGEKYFILSTVNALGGKNYFLAILYFVVGGISIVAGFLFWIGYKRFNRENEKTQKKE